MNPRDDVLPCAHNPALFESVNRADHRRAAAICATCPVIAWCAKNLAEVKAKYGYAPNMGPRGTWAGRLLNPQTPRKRCGTTGGYYDHLRGKTKTCTRCRDAINTQRREERAARTAP